MFLDAAKLAIAKRLIGNPTSAQGAVDINWLFDELVREGHLKSDLCAALYEMAEGGLLCKEVQRRRYDPPRPLVPHPASWTDMHFNKPTFREVEVVWPQPALRSWWAAFTSAAARAESGSATARPVVPVTPTDFAAVTAALRELLDVLNTQSPEQARVSAVFDVLQRSLGGSDQPSARAAVLGNTRIPDTTKSKLLMLFADYASVIHLGLATDRHADPKLVVDFRAHLGDVIHLLQAPTAKAGVAASVGWPATTSPSFPKEWTDPSHCPSCKTATPDEVRFVGRYVCKSCGRFQLETGVLVSPVGAPDAPPVVAQTHSAYWQPTAPSPGNTVKTDSLETVRRTPPNEVPCDPQYADLKETKSKRSTSKGEARSKIISALTEHHKYKDGGALNQISIGVRVLARKADVAPDSVTAFFNKEFGEGPSGGHARYKTICIKDWSRIATWLQMLNEDFSPHPLFGTAPPDATRREEDDDE
jgi:hypothetical protein